MLNQPGREGAVLQNGRGDGRQHAGSSSQPPSRPRPRGWRRCSKARGYAPTSSDGGHKRDAGMSRKPRSGLLAAAVAVLAGCIVEALPWAASCAAAPPTAFAEYPVRPIRIIVASSPGTADDFFARALGEELASSYRQRVVIDNRAGAGGLIGNQAHVARESATDTRWVWSASRA